MVLKFLWESNLHCVLQDDLAISKQKVVVYHQGLLNALQWRIQGVPMASAETPSERARAPNQRRRAKITLKYG